MSLGSERSEGPSSVESFAGVSLVQLAAIAAARAQGFPLEEILNAEGLEMDAYRAADIEYKCRLADSGERERLIAAYQEELSRAEDRLQRQISPLDDDIESWVRFLGTYGEQSSPAEWLTALGLTSTDLSRLSRTWKKRLDTDVALGKRAEKLAMQKMPYDISSLRVALAKLVPSPLAKPQTKSSLRETAPLPADAMLLVHRWLPRTEPPPEPSAQVDFSAKLQPLVPLSMTNPVFSLPEDDGLPFVEAPDVPDEPATPAERAADMAPPRDALSGTSLAVDIPRGPATPFEKLDKPLKEKETEVKPAGAALGGTSLALEIPRGPATPFEKLDKPLKEKETEVKPAGAALGGTSLALEIPRGPATPFEKLDKPLKEKEPEVKPAGAALGGTSLALEIPRGPATPFEKLDKPLKEKEAEVKPAAAALGGTSLALEIPRGPATPFEKSDKPLKENVPEVKPAAAALGGTSLALEIPRGPATPFEKLDKPLKEKEPEIKPAAAALGGTSLALEIPRGPATPFEKSDKPLKENVPEIKPAAAALGGTSLALEIPRESVLPFASAKQETAKQELSRPLLSLEEHAAMTVEIATYPARTLAILKRYGLAPPQKVDLDQHYQRIVTNDPAKQAAWHAAYNAHYVTLMRAPRR